MKSLLPETKTQIWIMAILILMVVFITISIQKNKSLRRNIGDFVNEKINEKMTEKSTANIDIADNSANKAVLDNTVTTTVKEDPEKDNS